MVTSILALGVCCLIQVAHGFVAFDNLTTGGEPEDNDVGTFANRSKWAQSFTPGKTAKIGEIKLNLYRRNNQSGPFTVEIWEGAAGDNSTPGAKLATLKTLNWADMPLNSSGAATSDYVSINQFEENIELSAQGSYWIVVSQAANGVFAKFWASKASGSTTTWVNAFNANQNTWNPFNEKTTALNLGLQVTMSTCLDSVEIGQVGTGGECAGMLIVDRGMLNIAKNDGAYAITGPDNNVYTFGASQHNIYTGQVTNLSSLFQNTTFNEDIGYWDVSNVTTFQSMFQFNGTFNQDLSDWNVTSKATSIRGIFNHSGAVDQDLSGWDISQVSDFFAAFASDHSKWSPANYDATLNAWAELSGSGKSFFPYSFHTSAGSDARANLIQKGWTITNDAFTADATAPSLTSSPANGAISVAVNASISLSFDEPVSWLGMNRANGNIVELIRSSDGHLIETFSVSARTFSSSFTLTPSLDLDSGTSYKIRISPIAFYDSSNNPFPGTSLTFQTETPLSSALVPTFNTASRALDGFTVQVSNYDAAFQWSAVAAGGSAVIDSNGLVTVTGIDNSTSATVTVSTTRSGFAEGSAQITESALAAALTPAFAAPIPTSDGFTVQVSNYDAAFQWSVVAAEGSAVIDSNGLVTVTDIDNSTSATVTVSTTRSGFAEGSATINGEVDTDGDGISDNQDIFPYADTEESTDGVTLSTTLGSSDSNCGITGFAVTETTREIVGTANEGIGIAVDFLLSGCSKLTPETISISIDLGTAPVAGSTAYKVDSKGDWTPIAGAAIDGAILTYSITDNDGVLDQNDALGVIEDPVTVAVPAAATPAATPVNVLPASALGVLSLLIGLLGWRGLRVPRRPSSRPA